MADVVDAATRSRMMSGIRGKNTRPEMLVRKFLHAHGFRFRLHRKDLPGVPDIVLPKYKTVVFVHGCFWHQHGNCRFAARPKSNADFWSAKLGANAARDARVKTELEQLGWHVVTVWECSLSQVELTRVASRILKRER
ncbi:DNA mismatch endonuclease Vsr [Ramlibacter terrae]|uniref:Very short patch repair endonuclease n=1 Tax=Ramlibacter terrae TaxID=2732511 RepID=A0ABX6P6C1_9BURK|nr:DNA mismatch endonuclease Vsr [Ramlibacter terrae]